MSRVTYVNPPNAPKVQGLYSHVAIAEPGRMGYIAGQVSVNKAGHVIGAGNFAMQAQQVFANLEAILKDLGCGFSDVAEFTTYLVGESSVDPWFKVRTDIYNRIYPSKLYPPNTLLVIDRLVKPEFLVEISAIARLP
jgi:enamine deaminase RidA (YjgF/YER057c/UK114 family)